MTGKNPRIAGLAGRALVAALPLVALWLLGAGDGGTGLVLIAVGVVAAIALALEPRTREISVLPLLLALTGLVATAPIGIATEVVAGASALTALGWVARDREDPGPIGRSLGGLTLPALAFGVALFTSVGLPAGRQFVGAAVVLLVVALAAVGWAIARPTRIPEASPS
ncbi:MAG TPA: hypothetical protein VIZ68_03830 [Thermoplasmata archaeon]